MEILLCNNCLKTKAKIEFYRNTSRGTGHNNKCIECSKNYSKERAKKKKVKEWFNFD